MKHFTSDVVIGLESYNTDNFYMIIDESGATDIVSSPKERVVGALIFFEDIKNLNSKFKNFIYNNTILREIISQKPHQLKYEKIKRYASVHNIEKDEIFCLILHFLMSEDCKPYWHNIKSDSKNIKEENEEEVYGKKFTKIILECNIDIVPNVILCRKREGNPINSIRIYCDEDIWKFDKLHIYLKGAEFGVFNQNIDNNSYDDHYEFDICRINSNNLLHQCCDIIAGIIRENLSKQVYERSKSYRILVENKFTDIVDSEYT